MANMSYCRFRNTAGDLRDCLRALEEMVEDPEVETLSRDEEAAAEWMEDLCRRYLQARAVIRDTVESDLGCGSDCCGASCICHAR